ncbi:MULTISPECIES: hypothetical protein [unclassified Comamonas]|uniref:hypothetical protein n=1 Tax=unclassified Comamonas TaxID=2638500 RepID=UPI001EFBFA52|nr:MULTISPECIES: hypothetical protein [unclassified Comamonas]ULR90251.1 hypothetical protein MJ205_05090 [Comamonas sp. B21-038]
MNKINFSLDSQTNDFVSVVLPSFRPGHNTIRTGKAKINVGRLVCAVDVELSIDALTSFRIALQECATHLRGRFSLISLDQNFILEAEMAPHGHARISVRTSFTLHRQRDEPQWSTSAHFACPADSLQKAAAALQGEQ